MRKRFEMGVFGALVAAALGAGSARAGVITFEGHPDDFEVSIEDSGFLFVTEAQGWGVISDDFVLDPPLTRNGTTRYAAAGGDPVTARVDVEPLDGLPFSLNAFDSATAYEDFAVGRIEVVGNLDGGGTVSTFFDLTNSFATYLLPSSFTNLTSFQVRDTFSGAVTETPGFSLDNIVFNAIPEPSTLALTGLAVGLGLVVGRKRMRRAG